MHLCSGCEELDPTSTNDKGVDGLSVVRHGVGFWPARSGGVRVQAGDLNQLNEAQKYGHGGGWYQARWWDAQEALRLIDEYFGVKR